MRQAIPKAAPAIGTAGPISGCSSCPGPARPLRAGVLLLIEKGDEHEILNTGRTPLRTLNIYVPPAYDRRGEPLPRGRR